jgi:5,5'-dehydrodivanillate O-demethylase
VVHEDGIRCGYHGWKWDFEGNCLEQPAEADNQNFRDRVKQKAGKAQAMGGMIWVYVGPDPAPELPRFDVFVMDGVKDCGYATLPCNWLQIMENSVDPHHVEWLHGYYFQFLGQTGGFDAPKAFQKKHIRTGFEEMEWGILKRRVLEGRLGGERRLEDRPPAGLPLLHAGRRRWDRPDADPGAHRRHHHLEVLLLQPRPQAGSWEPQARPVVYEYLWRDADGRFITDYIEGQDIMAWVSQGPVTDRTQEHLGRSDAGVALLARCSRRTCAGCRRGSIRWGPSATRMSASTCRARRTSSAPSASSPRPGSTGGSMRYGPIKEQLLDLHVSAWANREKAGAGA